MCGGGDLSHPTSEKAHWALIPAFVPSSPPAFVEVHIIHQLRMLSTALYDIKGMTK